MLGLLRKYQKGLFIVVATVVIASFFCYGTFSAFTGVKSSSNKVIGYTVDGKKVRETQLFSLMRFLGSDRQDVDLWQKGVMPNFLNDGVVRNDLIASGLASKIAKRYFDEFEAPLEATLAKARRYRSYAHPQAPFISADNIWQQFMPSLAEHLSVVRNPDLKPSAEAFEALLGLYLDQTQFPSSILRQLIGFQEKQFSWITHDRAIERLDLSLFNAHSLQDWFGPRFVELCAQVVLNGAAYAESKGYKVSYAEARTHLFRNGIEFLQSEKGKKEIDSEELSGFLSQQFAQLQMDERTAVEAWQKVMLFRTWLADASHSSFLDPLLYEDFLSFANDALDVAHYQVPQEVRLSNMMDIAEFQIYLESLGISSDDVALPLECAGKPSHPELLQERYRASVALVSQDHVAQNIGIKQTWQWQLEGSHWNKLAEKFPMLASLPSGKETQRRESLESLDDALRDQIDAYSRMLIVQESPSYIDEAFALAPTKEREIWVTNAGLSNLFGRAEVVEGLQESLNATSEQALVIASPDRRHFASVRLIEKLASGETLTFAQARSRGILSTLLEARLAQAYPKIRNEEPSLFKNSQGEFLSLDQVKPQVAKRVYKKLLINLEKELAKCGVKLEGAPLSQEDQFYAHHRFLPFLEKGRQDLLAHKESSSFLKQIEGGIANQWKIEKSDMEVLRKSPENWISENSFDMKEGEWSQVIADRGGGLTFFQVKGKKAGHADLSQEMQQGQNLIASEAKAYILEELLDEIESHQALIHSCLRDNGAE